MSSPYRKKYQEEVLPELMKDFSYKNVHSVPKMEKIVLSTCLKELLLDKKLLLKIEADLARITGQKPRTNCAKKSIANFKLREGQPLGCSVILRRKNMYEFMNRLLNIVLPRVRDFRGVSPKGFDGRGNYNMGLSEHTIFPEIPHDKIEQVFGMNITFVTSAKTDDEGQALLKKMGMPFRK